MVRGKTCRYNCQSCGVVDKVEMRCGYSREGSTMLKMSKVDIKRGQSACKKLVVCAGKNEHRLREKETWEMGGTVAHTPSPAIRSGCLLETLLCVSPTFCLQPECTSAKSIVFLLPTSSFLCQKTLHKNVLEFPFHFIQWESSKKADGAAWLCRSRKRAVSYFSLATWSLSLS